MNFSFYALLALILKAVILAIAIMISRDDIVFGLIILFERLIRVLRDDGINLIVHPIDLTVDFLNQVVQEFFLLIVVSVRSEC